VLHVRDLAWLTPAAYRALWEHLGRFDLVREVTWRSVPTDDPLPHLLLEPRMLNATARDGLLARLVDVDRALAARPYAAAAALTFEVVDELCPWNAGRWRADTTAAGAEVRRTGEEPQLTLPVSTLAMLLFGQITATEAARMGRLDAHEPDALMTWDLALRTKHRPFCPDQF
jgi:predicted acetyltransferase